MKSLLERPPVHPEPIDNVSIKMVKREHRNKVTKTPFDTTGLSTWDRPGDLKKKEVVFDPDAFTDHTTTIKPTTDNFLKKRTGTGGLSSVEAKAIVRINIKT